MKKNFFGDFKMKKDWKIKFSILMIIAAIIIFGTNYLVLKDTHSIVSYVWLHIGFIPIDIIIVAFILEEIMNRKEKEAIYEKLDMLISTFFSEIGNELIEEFSSANEFKASTSYLKDIPNWDDDEYNNQLKKLKNGNNIDFNVTLEGSARAEFLINLRELLKSKREFLINLINNPQLFEKEEFSGLLISILHLDEELEHRPDLNQITDVDFNHLNGDIKRIYSKLIYEWIYYLKYLNTHYPYIISLVIRTNPFDEDADIHIK